MRDYLCAPSRANVSLIVRAAQRRRTLAVGQTEGVPPCGIFEAMQTARVLGKRTIKVEPAKGSSEISLDVNVYAAQVHRPK